MEISRRASAAGLRKMREMSPGRGVQILRRIDALLPIAPPFHRPALPGLNPVWGQPGG